MGTDLLSRRHRDLRALLARRLRGARVRFLARSTAVYTRFLLRKLYGGDRGSMPRFSRSERAQLDNLDVPYFFRKGGGPILYYDPYPWAARRSDPLPKPPDAPKRGGPPPFGQERFAVLLQDSLDHVVKATHPVSLRSDGIRLKRRRRSPITEFQGRVGPRTWTVRLDCEKGEAEVSVLPGGRVR